MMYRFLAVFDDYRNPLNDGGSVSFGQALLIALVAILIVFVVLCLIIGSIKLLQVCVKKFGKKNEAKEEASAEVSQAPALEEAKPATEIEDDDMMAAVLVATIDYANETKSDVKLKSVKRIG